MTKTISNDFVFDGVHAVKTTYAANKPLWVYVIEGDIVLWVDVGINSTPNSVVFPYLMNRAPRAWVKTQLALITHADVDHFGGLRGFKGRRPDVLVLAHAADKRWIESPPAVMQERYMMHAADGITVPPERQTLLLERGGGGGKVDFALVGHEKLDLGPGGIWTVLHTPGHSAGHVALWNERRRWAIIGDAALDWGVPDDDGRLLSVPPYYDVTAYEASVKMLRDLRAERVFTSHYGIMESAAAEAFYDRSLAAMETIETALTTVLAEQPEGLVLTELCLAVGQVAARWDESLWPGLADPLSAHLQRLIARGTVERMAAGGGKIAYRRAGRS